MKSIQTDKNAFPSLSIVQAFVVVSCDGCVEKD